MLQGICHEHGGKVDLYPEQSSGLPSLTNSHLIVNTRECLYNLHAYLMVVVVELI